jgi:Flp pilus assembly protein TadB
VVALIVGVGIALTTGWLIAIPLLPVAVLGLPTVLVVSDAGKGIERIEAISEWTRSLAGVLTAGQGLEGAIQASLRSAPEAIRPEVARLVGRLRAYSGTEEALRAFGDDLNDATGDLVVGALILGSAQRGEGLARVLTGLSESVAEDVRARREIEIERNKPRSTARMVTLISASALAFFALTGQFLAPYRSPVGQVVLAGLLAAYAGSLMLMRRMSRVAPVPRFLEDAAGARR